MAKPTGTIAKSGLELLTFGTPNGHKASIILEELKEAYGKPDYVYQTIDIRDNTQKEPWFTKYGPNGRIPVLVDHDKGGLGIQEGMAILSYLTRHFDPEHKFSFADDPELSLCEQWVAWQHGGLGPMQGQANHFFRLAPERIPYPTQRYVGETERLIGILNTHLSTRPYLVGDRYSIADIASYCWVNVSYFSGIKLDGFPHVKTWWEKISARPAVQKGLHVPGEPFAANASMEKRLAEDEEARKGDEKLWEELRKAKEQYKYKYSSP